MSRAHRSTVPATPAVACSPVTATPRSRWTRFTIAHRIRALAAVRGARLIGAAMHRRIAKRLQMQNLAVQIAGPTGAVAKSAVGRFRAFARIG